MRILYWNPLYWPQIGGMEVAGATLLRALRARGHTASVVTSHDTLDLPDEEEHDGIPIRRFPFRRALATRDPRLLLDSQRRVAEHKRAFQPDLVHVNLPDPGAVVHLRTLGAHPAKLVVTIHASIAMEDGGRDSLVGALLRDADWVVAPSAAILHPVRRAMPGLAPRSSVIHYGLEALAEPPSAPADEPCVLCPGRLIREKGFDLAITAFASLEDRFPRARLVLAGDGPERPRLERQARDLGIAHRTHFAGWVPPARMPAVLSAASVVVVPSRWEDAFPVVALEAAWMARPVVAAGVGGLPESVADGETGLLVEPEDARGLADALATMLEDPDRAARMGRAARERARTTFGVERYADDYEQLYRHLTEESIHAGR